MSEPQPTVRPEAGPRYYECRSEGDLHVRYWDGHELRINRESCNTEPLACYTDFRPLSVVPVGWRELVAQRDNLLRILSEMTPRYCEMFEACGLGNPMDSVIIPDALAALAPTERKE